MHEVDTILMVADEADQRTLFTLILSSHGFHVDDVEDAESALARLSEHAYALLLTDYELPMMNGPEFISTVRQRWPSMPVVLMSSHVDLRYLAGELKVDGYLDKMDTQHLPCILRDVLQRHIP